MKKTYTTLKALAVFLSLLSLNLSAQISGTVTINNAAATAGSNYQTFNALASALNTGGVNGPLVVNVLTGTNSGVYNEQVSFSTISGVSATNTITVNGNSCTLTFASASSATPWTLNLNGSDRMFFNTLNVHATGATYQWACCLSAGADYNTFSACTFSCPLNSTSTSGYPVIFSGSNSGVSAANSANYCTFKNCNMLNGWYGLYMYGLTSAPFQTNNSILNCNITDYYYMGVYCYYQKFPTVKGCVSSRPTRTANYSTIYGYYFYASQGGWFEGNRSEKLFDNQQTTTTGCYGIFFAYSPNAGNFLNTLRNNIVCDIKSNGLIYGIYGYYPDGYVYHNTVSLDHTASTQNSTTFGIYMYGLSGYTTIIRNNMVSITRGGTGTKSCYYSGGTTGNSTIDNNNYYINAAAGTANYVGYYTSYVTSLAALQAQGIDANSYSLNPQFSALPSNLLPTNTLLNNKAAAVGVPMDYSLNPRDGSTPDIGALEFLSQNCSGVTSTNSVFSPTAPICPNTSADLGVNYFNSDLGITYQWLASPTSTAGPWTPIPGENSVYYTTPNLNTASYFAVQITCTFAASSLTFATAVNIATTVINQIPYYEGFEGIAKTNQLPNCSWSSSSPGVANLTYTMSNTQNRMPRTGTKFASFYYLPIGASYYYTNGIQMNAGITYSAALWYTTEYVGYNNWTDLSIMYGTTQTTTGLTTIASSNGPAVSNIYKLLSNTFTVATSGVYYVAVKGTAASGSAQWLSWDDLSITIPCQLNSPTLNVTANNQTVCVGDEVMLNVSGADTYTWTTGANMGATTSSVSEYPTFPTTYGVIGTSNLTGCSIAQNINIMVNPSPSVLMYASSPTVCAGKPVNLTAFGAASYQWNPVPGSSAMVVVNPTITTTYSVVGTDPNGCSGTAMQTISVSPLPNINVTQSAPSQMCADDVQTIGATGAATYVWVSSTGSMLQGTPLVLSNMPVGSISYTVTGTDISGCSNTQVVTQNVDACTGISKNSALSGLNVYPNPTSSVLTVELNNSLTKTITVSDLTGRVVMATTNNNGTIDLNLNELANGVYYVKVSSDNASEVIKVVKQ